MDRPIKSFYSQARFFIPLDTPLYNHTHLLVRPVCINDASLSGRHHFPGISERTWSFWSPQDIGMRLYDCVCCGHHVTQQTSTDNHVAGVYITLAGYSRTSRLPRYSESTLAEMTTPAALELIDSIAIVENITLFDRDLHCVESSNPTVHRARCP